MNQSADMNCIYCSGKNVTIKTGNPGSAIEYMMDGETKLIGYSRRRTSTMPSANVTNSSEFVPVYYHCNQCGKDFLSYDTYMESIKRVNLSKPAIVSALIWCVLGVAICFGAIVEDMTFLVPGAIVTAVGVITFIRYLLANKTLAALEKDLSKISGGGKWRCSCGYLNNGKALICQKCNTVR